MSELGSYELVAGLEVHTELKTETKLFCGCPNEFGAEPNTNVCPVCLGLPGSLPVLNRRAVELAMAIGLALNCEVRPSSFHRKNYFYPDMPKDYQISQYDEPINVDGSLALPDGSVVGIVRAHIEEDTGKTLHVGATGRIHGADRALVDYNRAGVPLVEIVSAPDLTSAAQAHAYVSELRGILVATGASDGRMEEGSLRIDANVSVRRVGTSQLGTRCEIKNLNSLRSLLRAVDHEARRQVDLLEAGGTVDQETRHWDEQAGRTVTMRSKEEAYDYRYFPEPDLVPIAPDAAWQAAVAASLPELPAKRRGALAALFTDASAAHADQITSVVGLDLDGFVVAACDAGVPPALALARVANEVAAIDDASSLAVAKVIAVLQMEASGELSATQAKAVLADVAATGGDPRELAAARGFERLGGDVLDATIDELIATHGEEWTRYEQGDDKLAQFFIGQVMRVTGGKADGKAVIAGLERRRGSGGT
jgi:aspartyl-tRNA(Asn)/glutamyl-tRNA(Gln) amidotransferase subunit B